MYLLKQISHAPFFRELPIKISPQRIIKLVKMALCIGLPLLMLALPQEWFYLGGLTTLQYRTVAIFLLAATSWVLEPIPVFATSILVIFLELICLSDSGLAIAMEGDIGTVLSYREIIGTLASPIIVLFLGGFFLANAATKFKMDQAMAKVFIKPFGTSPKMVMLGLMAITAVFSMFMSNTATTAMMLSILVPVLACMDHEDKGRLGFVLSIPVAANIGGLGTPIGTPPNAIAMKYLTGEHAITFSKWMVIGIPFVIIMILIAWLILNSMFPTSTKKIQLNFKASKKSKGIKPIIVYATFGVTVLLWLTDFVHGINAYVVAMLPIAVFLCLNVIERSDLKDISWDVLWLVSGGIALGLALDQTGLAKVMVEAIPFEQIPILWVFGLTAILGIVVANFMSNTATANLVLPIIIAIGVSLPGLEDFGGLRLLVLSTTLCVSLGMALPISTPPNALAYSTGLITTKHLVKVGTIIGVIGLVLVFTVLYIEANLGLI